jgi:ankyrin repeat protein
MVDITILLLSYPGVDVNVINTYEESAFSYACKFGEDSLIAQFLRLGANLFISNGDNVTPLMHIVGNKNIFNHGIIFKNTSIDDASTVYSYINATTSSNKTAIFYALPSAVSFLADMGALINHKDIHGKTALHYACAKNDVDLMESLLSVGADPNIGDNHNIYPIHYVCTESNIPGLHVLLRHNAKIDVQNSNGFMPLMMGDLTTTNILLECGANPNVSDNFNATPLYYACQNNDLEKVQLLLRYNADPNGNQYNLSPLLFACRHKNMDIITELAMAGGMINYDENPESKEYEELIESIRIFNNFDLHL